MSVRCRRLALALTVLCWPALVPPAWAEGAAPRLPFRPDEAVGAPGAEQWLAAGLACAALLVLLLWWLRRRGVPFMGLQPAEGTQVLKVLQRLPLTAQSQLVLVRYGDRMMLVAVGPGYSTCLRDDALPGASAASPQPVEGGLP